MAVPFVLISARVAPAVASRLQLQADKKSEGNRSMLVRSAVNLYVELSDLYGARFEIIVEELRERAEAERAA